MRSITYKASPITLGKLVKSIEVGGFILTETVHPPRLALPRHAHERANISFVLDGSFTEIAGRHEHECSPSSWLVKPAGEIHSNRYGREGARCLIIEVEPQRLEAIRPVSEILDRATYAHGGALATLALRVYREFRIRDSASGLAMEGLVLEMLAQATRRRAGTPSSTRPYWLHEARDFIHEHFARQVGLFKVAQSVGVHPAHLARTFRKHYGCTVGEYVRRLRLDYAAQELIQSDKSLVEITLAAGFYDQSHFTHAFKLQMGMTPAEFRNAIRTRKAATKRLRSSKTS